MADSDSVYTLEEAERIVPANVWARATEEHAKAVAAAACRGAGSFEAGRVYRCVGTVLVWEVDRVTSSGPSRSGDRDLPAGSVFRVDTVWSGDEVEITILEGEPASLPGDVGTGDYHTRSDAVAHCEVCPDP